MQCLSDIVKGNSLYDTTMIRVRAVRLDVGIKSNLIFSKSWLNSFYLKWCF